MPGTASGKETRPAMSPIPLLDLKKQYADLENEIAIAVRDVLESGAYVLGPKVKAFEDQVAAYCGVKHAIGVASGTDALLLALMAEGVGPGDEVILPTYTFFATAGVVHRLGATPVFVDVDPVHYNVTAADIEAKITGKTKAVIPVHLFGQSAPMGPIMDVCKKRNVVVIEDAAQAIGAKYEGRMAGTIGDYGCYSFYPTKNLGGYGDGGMIVTNSDERADLLRQLRVHGARPKYIHAMVGVNSRLDALQAAILSVKLPHLDAWADKRRKHAATYQKRFAGTKVTRPARRRTAITCTTSSSSVSRSGTRSWPGSRRRVSEAKYITRSLCTSRSASRTSDTGRAICPCRRRRRRRRSPFPCIPT